MVKIFDVSQNGVSKLLCFKRPDMEWLTECLGPNCTIRERPVFEYKGRPERTIKAEVEGFLREHHLNKSDLMELLK